MGLGIVTRTVCLQLVRMCELSTHHCHSLLILLREAEEGVAVTTAYTIVMSYSAVNY